jgi:ferredoxin
MATVIITKQEVINNPQTLDKTLRAKGYDVQTHCGQGVCGNCRCKKIEGEVHYLRDAIGYHADDEILPCISIPKTAKVVLLLNH